MAAKQNFHAASPGEISYCHYVCDLESERPSSGMREGDTAFAKDTNKQWVALSATTWQEVGGGGAHPDLAAHDTLGLATDTELSNHASAADPHIVYQKESERNAASGYAGLDAATKLAGSQQIYGALANTACEGNDGRLSDARTPTAHKISHEPGGSDAMVVDAVAATGSLRTLGAGTQQAAAGNHTHAGGSGPTHLLTASNQSITVAGFVDITGLSFSVVANGAYWIKGFVRYRTSTTAMGVKFGINGPASPTLIPILSSKEITAPGTAGTDKFSEAVLQNYNIANPVSTAEPVANADLLWKFEGIFVNGSNAGTFALRFDKENVSGTATIMANSYMQYQKIN